MTEIKTTKIPQRQKCVNKEDPYVAGAEDIKDDAQGLTQAQINAIVLGDAISVSLSASKDSSSTEDNPVVKLTASCSVNATITIKRGDEVVITANNVKTLNATHAFAPSTSTLLDTYTATFKIGELVKTVTINVGAIFVVCGENWTGAQDVSPDLEDSYMKTSPSGTYNVNVTKYISVATPGPFHVYFIIPRSMSISGATMSGFDFPLESGVNSTFQGANCKYYESSNDYPEGTLTIKIS